MTLRRTDVLEEEAVETSDDSACVGAQSFKEGQDWLAGQSAFGLTEGYLKHEVGLHVHLRVVRDEFEPSYYCAVFERAVEGLNVCNSLGSIWYAVAVPGTAPDEQVSFDVFTRPSEAKKWISWWYHGLRNGLSDLLPYVSTCNTTTGDGASCGVAVGSIVVEVEAWQPGESYRPDMSLAQSLTRVGVAYLVRLVGANP